MHRRMHTRAIDSNMPNHQIFNSNFFCFFFLGTTTESENRERIVAIGVATVDRRMMGTVLLCALQRDGLCHWKEFRDSFRMLLVVI